MLTQDLNSYEKRTTRLMTVDVVQRFREAWNRFNGNIDNYSLEIPFPEDFVRSGREKYLKLIKFKIMWANATAKEIAASIYKKNDDVFYDSTINLQFDSNQTNDLTTKIDGRNPPHITLHASFVQEDDNDNQLVCFNDSMPASQGLKYKIHTTTQSFKVWFVDYFQRKKMSLLSISKVYGAIIIQFELDY